MIISPQMLVISDDHLIVNYIHSSCDRWKGYELQTARPQSNLLDQIALMLNEQSGLELIIIDIDAFSSLEWLKNQIKQIVAYKQIPLIGIVSRENYNCIEELSNIGITDYLARPICLEDLSMRIKLALGRRKKSFSLDKLDYNRKLRKDVALARQIQAGVLPVNLNNQQLSIEGAYLPAKTLGGDMYYWHRIDNTQYGIILIDVMGHGVATALISMLLRSILPGLIMEYVHPKDVIFHLNKHMINFNNSSNRTWEYSFSAIYLLINTEENTIRYVNGGMPTGILVQGQYYVELYQGCTMLGVLEKLPIQEGVIKYQVPGHIFLYTDGLIDCTGLASEEIGAIVTEYAQWFDKADSLLRKLIVIDPMKLERQDDIAIIKVSLWE